MNPIFEGTLTPQDIFNINVDTQARWDKITSIKNDFDVPAPNFPDYDFGKSPLNRDSQMTIYDGLFSDNPQIKESAKAAINNSIAKSPEMKYNLGFKIDTPYDQAKKYVHGEFGFDPTRDNEDFYHQNTYANKGLAGRAWDNTYKGLGRLTGGIVTKLGQSLGHLGGMIWGAGENAVDLITGKDNHSFIETMAENAVVKWFEQSEETIKDQWMPIFKPANWDEKGFFSKLGSGQYWSDELADGAAFMGAMIAETYLMGGLGRMAGLGGLGAKAITGSSRLAKLARGAQLLATGSDDLGGMAQWALSVAGESAFESSSVYKNVKQDLKDRRKAGESGYADMTDEEIEKIAGERASQSFKGNMLVLSLSNAFENRMIFQPLMKRFRGNKKIDFEDGNQVSKGVRVSEDISTRENFAMAESARPKYAEGFKGRLEGYWNIAKKIKDPHGALRFYGSKALQATVMEGYWEENAQLAIERLANMGHLNTKSFVNQYLGQTYDSTWFGKGDKEASESIGAGMVIGVLGSAGTSAAMRERKKLKEATQNAIDHYENVRRSYLTIGDIYERDGNNNLIKDEENGGYKINKDKAEAFLAGLNEHLQIQETIDKLQDPIQRAVLQEQLLGMYVGAAKRAGIHNTVAARMDKLSTLTSKQVADLGFDPTSVENVTEFQNNFKEQSKIYDDVFNSKKDVEKPKDVKYDEFNKTNDERKIDLYNASTMMRALQRAADKYNALGIDNNVREGRIGSNPFNLMLSAQVQLQSLMEFMDQTPESSFYKDYFANRIKELTQTISNHQNAIATMQEADGIGEFQGESVVYDEYKQFVDEKGKFLNEDAKKAALDKFKSEQNESFKHGILQNTIAQYKYIKEQISHPKDGYNNYLEYKKYKDQIKKIDDAIDTAENPQEEDVAGKDSNISDSTREEKKKERKNKKKEYETRTPWVKKGTNGTKYYKLKEDNRIAEDLYAYYGIPEMGVGNLRDMVQKMIDNPYTHPYLAEAFTKMLAHIPADATVKFDTKQTFAPGYYQTGTNQIVIDPEMVDHTNMSFEGVMLHELIHLLTSDELVRNSYFTREMQNLYEETVKELDDRGIDTAYYGFTNVHEFLAEAYSNPEFQAVLLQVKSKYGVKSAWEKFMDILSNFLKEVLGIDMSPSRLDDIFMNVEEFLNDEVYKEAVKQLKAKGMTDEDLKPYTKREIIDLAEREGLIDLGGKKELPPPKVADDLKSIKAKIKDHIVAQLNVILNDGTLTKELFDSSVALLDRDNWLELYKPRLKSIYFGNEKGLAELEKLIEEYIKLKNAEVTETFTVEDFAKRLAAGEKMDSPAALQFYDNNKAAIETQLQKIKEDEEKRRLNSGLDAKRKQIRDKYKIEIQPRQGAFDIVVDGRLTSIVSTKEEAEALVNERVDYLANALMEGSVNLAKGITQIGISVDGLTYDVLNTGQRMITLVEVDGVVVPFYLTTGHGGKGLIPGWYPFFGYGADGWLNKTGKQDMEQYYEKYLGPKVAARLKEVAEKLNEKYGTTPNTIKETGIIPNKDVTGAINRALPFIPTSNNMADTLDRFDENMKVLAKQFGIKSDDELSVEEQIREWLELDLIPKAYEAMAKADPNGFLRFVASQAQNVAEDLTTPLQGDVRQSTMDIFGETIVNYAVELYPAKGQEPKTLSKEAKEALKEAFQMHEQAIIEGKTYDEVMEERGITKKGNNIDRITDNAKGDSTVAAPTGKPNEINKDGSLNVADNLARLARFNFMQRLSDSNNKDGYKLKIVVQEKNGKLLVKGKVVDYEGNPITFDINGKEAKGADTHVLQFDIDLISYNTKSLGKPRLTASGLMQNPLEVAMFNLHDSFKDKDGNPLPDVNQKIAEYLKSIIEKEPVYADIVDIMQGHLVRPGVTNDVKSLTQDNAPRRTLAELENDGHVYDNDNGSITPKTKVANNTYVRGGSLNIKLKRNINTDSHVEGFELVEFKPNTIGNLVDEKGNPLIDKLRPILEKALKGELSSQGNYLQLLKTLLNARGFKVLDMGNTILVVHEKKFMNYFKQYVGQDISAIETLQNADLLKNEILSLTTIDDILNAEMNIDKNLYETKDNPMVYVNQFPAEFKDFILNYKDIVKNNVTTSAIPVKVSEQRSGYARVNKRLVVSLDKTFQDMKNEVSKQEQEQTSNPDDTVIKDVHNVNETDLFNTLTSDEEVDREDLTKGC